MTHCLNASEKTVMSTENKTSFFEPKTLIIVVIVAATYMGWQTYLQKKYPNYGKPAVQVAATTSDVATENKQGDEAAKLSAVSEATDISMPAIPSETFIFNSSRIGFVLDSNGMGLKDVTINNYTDKNNAVIKIGASATGQLFQVKLTSSPEPMKFSVKVVGPGHYIGTSLIGTAEVTRELQYIEKTNSFTNKLTVKNAGPEFLAGLTMTIPETVLKAASTSMLFPSMEFQDFIIEENGKVETVPIMGTKENIAKDISSSSLIAVSSHYFAASILDKSDLLPKVSLSTNLQTQEILAKLNYLPTQLNELMSFEQILYVGPKSMEHLQAVDANLSKIIDFGFFSFIAVPLLKLLKVCHSAVGNWGFAIICLTLIVRLLVLPFNMMSFKSMKAMQKIQPMTQALREKYKNDPARMNSEMMALMKEHGANPLGGCLPMLLQIPIFFALYKVINSSVELYQSPFMFWITDLSMHDKFYVLPVLMGISMFVQQKLTPSTMDPTQAKIMAFMPLVFSLFMLNLPSGLTLYMFVSTLFGIIQQYFMMKEKKPVSI